jgi:hypothetical protein
LDNIIKSIVNNYNWTPKTISKMYCDDLDFQGLLYWYKEVEEIDKKVKNQKK